MNTAKLKKYAPQARREFITAVSKQFNQLGIYSDKQISEVKQEGSVLLIEGKTFKPSVKTARERLVKKVQAMGYNQLVEQVAYTWFNRLCAIRYMEIHDYLGHGFRVLSYPASHPDNSQGAGATNKGRFEIIDHAQDAADELGLDRARIIELKLAGNKDEELYRELLLGQCHKLHEAMPFLFDALDDETELLLPDNLTRTDSILRGLVDGIPEEDWQQVEVIGWLYQFYISEKKDQVMGKVVKSEDIPAATQLFTPNWIVKYLVQNSVGRQWLQTYPDSAIKSQMEYYIEPAEQSDVVNQQLKAITPESIEPETIKVLDPACGSGHILIEAYNVLKAIYEERGFRSRDIPKMILENNLYGLDIDDRAAQLSGFALMMMARDDDKRIFTRNVRLNVLSLQESNHIDLPTLWKALNLSGSWQSGTSQGLFSDDDQDLSSFNADNRYQLLKRTLARFTQAKTFGSLIDVPSDEHDQLKELLNTLVELQESGDSMQKPAAKQLIEIVHQALVLSIRYDAVIANPPYMGSKGMNADLKDFAKKNYPDSKSDLFAIFMERAFSLLSMYGFNAQINMQSWMFLSSYEKLREYLLNNHTLVSMAHLGARAFSQISGEVVQTTAFIFSKNLYPDYRAKIFRLTNGIEREKMNSLLCRENEFSSLIQSDYKKIPGSPVAYWISNEISSLFSNYQSFDSLVDATVGCFTCNNDLFLKYWYEIDFSNFKSDVNNWDDLENLDAYYFPYNKGGGHRRWYGQRELVIKFRNQGGDIRQYRKDSGQSQSMPGEKYYFQEGVTWSDIASDNFGARYTPSGAVFDIKGASAFPEHDVIPAILAIMSSNLFLEFMRLVNPTSTFQVGDIRKLPLPPLDVLKDESFEIVWDAVKLSKEDYSESEISFEFVGLDTVFGLMQDNFNKYRFQCEKRCSSLVEVENRIEKVVSNSYSLNSDLKERTFDDISMFTNFFRDGELVSDELKDYWIRNVISYYFGCVMARYAIDHPGLIIASPKIGLDHFYSIVKQPKFFPDEDGIVPLTDQEWFKDDATNRFREFVQVVWGEEHLQENLDFVAESLCLNAIKPKKSESALETIRRYLSTQFYKDHLKTYKKRPIYWLFSSGKQKAFECLVYLHRYNEGTLSRMRTEYVTPLLGKYDAYAGQLEKQIETADSTSEANRFKKELDALVKKQVELREFDDKLKHYADMRISLDLDDGVKMNYGKFGDLLADVKAITGYAAEE